MPVSEGQFHVTRDQLNKISVMRDLIKNFSVMRDCYAPLCHLLRLLLSMIEMIEIPVKRHPYKFPLKL